MNAHRYRDEPRCLAKLRYSTEEEARAAAMCSCSAFGKPCMSVYECGFCGGWHVTSQRGHVAMRVTAQLSHMQVRVAM